MTPPPPPPPNNGTTSVLTQHNDNLRTGQNMTETVLTTSNVNTTQFGRLFALPVAGQVYAQPLYVAQVSIAGGKHNILIIATEADLVYAFDADTAGAPLWTANLVDAAHGATVGETPVDSASSLGCTDLQPQIGITATPAIDPVAKIVYVEAKSGANGTSFFHRLHALDLLTGNEKAPGPTVISATVPGTGDGSNAGSLPFDDLHQNERPGLLLLNGMVYLAYASHCDFFPYHGWLLAYDTATFRLKSVFNTTPNGGLGGFWMSGAGIAADASNNLYLATGNGTFDTTKVPATALGDSIVKFGTASGTLTFSDYFTPFNEASLDSTDTDVGSGGVILLPDQPGNFPHVLAQAGKEGRIYFLNRDRMTSNPAAPGQEEPYCSGCASDPQIISESSPGTVGGMWCMPAFWNNALYFWGAGDVLKSIPVVNGLPNFGNITNGAIVYGFPGATPSISSNGTMAGSAIVWSIDSSQYGSPGPGPGPAVLHAGDATNVTRELWNSAQAAGNRDVAGNAVKFTVPTIANGKVYVGTSTEVDVYGLLR